MNNFGTNIQASATVALRLIANDIVAIRMFILSAVLNKIGTKASQIIQVVYIVNPICFDSLKASGILRDTIA
jgi:hypothetical protein